MTLRPTPRFSNCMAKACRNEYGDAPLMGRPILAAVQLKTSMIPSCLSATIGLRTLRNN